LAKICNYCRYIGLGLLAPIFHLVPLPDVFAALALLAAANLLVLGHRHFHQPIDRKPNATSNGKKQHGFLEA
jgi:hypothetical protein